MQAQRFGLHAVGSKAQRFVQLAGSLVGFVHAELDTVATLGADMGDGAVLLRLPLASYW